MRSSRHAGASTIATTARCTDAMADDAYTPGFVPSDMLQTEIACATQPGLEARPERSPASSRGHGPLA